MAAPSFPSQCCPDGLPCTRCQVNSTSITTAHSEQPCSHQIVPSVLTRNQTAGEQLISPVGLVCVHMFSLSYNFNMQLQQKQWIWRFKICRIDSHVFKEHISMSLTATEPTILCRAQTWMKPECFWYIWKTSAAAHAKLPVRAPTALLAPEEGTSTVLFCKLGAKPTWALLGPCLTWAAQLSGAPFPG